LYKAVNVKGVDTLELDLLISTWQGLGCSMGEAKLRVLRSGRIAARRRWSYYTAQIRNKG
jgi:hypothetical protein